jgi:hypothetical protein
MSLDQSDVARLVHFEHPSHRFVTKSPDFTSVCKILKNLSFDFSHLNNCLFFRQTVESPRILQKFRGGENFSSMLSTETVDSFSLATARGSLQRTDRIAASEMASAT